MHQAVNGLELAANVEVLSSVVQVLDGRVSNVTVLVEDKAGLLLPARYQRTFPCARGCRGSLVGLVDILDGHDGEVAVVTEVAEDNASTGLHTDLVNGLLRDIEGDGHGEDIAVGKTLSLNDAARTC